MKQIKISKVFTQRDGSSAFKAYLHDIQRYPILTPDEEIELVQRIHQGDRAALDRLVNCNLRFVISIAKQYPVPQGLQLFDLINEGNAGLVKAAERFDETRGFKFISYAVHWIRQSIIQACTDFGRMVRVPANRLAEQHRIFQFIAEYEQQHEQRPSIAEIADALDVPEERVSEMLGHFPNHSSIDAPLQDGDSFSLLDVIHSDTDLANESMEHESLRTEIRNALKMLSDRDREVLMSIYGIDRPECSYEEISNRMGLSRERCRQIRERATKFIRYSSASSALQSYL